jgi:hypothetical protein
MIPIPARIKYTPNPTLIRTSINCPYDLGVTFGLLAHRKHRAILNRRPAIQAWLQLTVRKIECKVVLNSMGERVNEVLSKNPNSGLTSTRRSHWNQNNEKRTRRKFSGEFRPRWRWRLSKRWKRSTRSPAGMSCGLEQVLHFGPPLLNARSKRVG